MNILGFSFNKKKSKTEFLPVYNYSIEFLKCIKNTPYSDVPFDKNSYWLNRFYELNIDSYKLIDYYIQDGCLRISSKEEDLTIPQLKVLLKNEKLSTAGNKQELVERVKSFIRDKQYLMNLRQYYKITEKGKQVILNDDFRFKNECSIYFDHILNLINNEGIQEAISLEKSFRTLNPDQRTLGVSLNEVLKGQENSFLIAHYFFENPKLLHDFKLRYEINKYLTSLLTCYSLLSINIKFKIFEQIKKIDFTSFEYFYEHETKDLLGDTEVILNKFLVFEYSYAYNLLRLKDYSRDIFRKRNLGIEIINSNCICCSKLGEEKFLWQNLAYIPKLPRFIDCTCIYSRF